MAKKANQRENSRMNKDNAMHRAMKLFIAGFLAEAYLLLLRRFYINGTIDQVVAWDGYLQVILYAALVLTAAGLAAGLALRKKNSWEREAAWIGFGFAAFITVSTWLVRRYMYTALTPLCVIVPVVMVLGLLWNLYDRECGYSLTVLAATVLVLWVCRKGRGTVRWNTMVLVAAALYLVVMAVVGWAFYQGEKKNNVFKGIRLLPSNADALPVYGACGLSLAAVLVGLISGTAAYYAMWAVCLVIFALAVYYTVKQL